MNNILIFSFLAFALTGLLTPTISEVFSEQPAEKPQACNNEQAKHVGNKHCDDGGSEPPTDPTQFTICDHTPIDGNISAEEIRTHLSESGTDYSILTILEWINESSTDGDEYVNNDRELKKLNNILRTLAQPQCV